MKIGTTSISHQFTDILIQSHHSPINLTTQQANAAAKSLGFATGEQDQQLSNHAVDQQWSMSVIHHVIIGHCS
jgi:hypothetical protein